jgi:hypothetical protein
VRRLRAAVPAPLVVELPFALRASARVELELLDAHGAGPAGRRGPGRADVN